MADFGDELNFEIKLEDEKPQANQPQAQAAKQNRKVEAQAIGPDTIDKFDLKKAAHPGACIATFAFKLCAIFFYLIIGSFIESNIITFIFVIMFSSLDFWVVKNITGRLLVGLRWWSQIDKDGNEQWRYESPNQGRNNNVVDKAFFWASQIIGTAVWAILLVLKVLTLSIFWSLLVFVCFSLCSTNLYGYYQCRGDHQKKLGQLKKQGLMNIMGKVF